MVFQIGHYVAVGVKGRKKGRLYSAYNTIAQKAQDIRMGQLFVILKKGLDWPNKEAFS